MVIESSVGSAADSAEELTGCEGAFASQFLCKAGLEGLLLQCCLDGVNDVLYSLWTRFDCGLVLC